MEKSPIRVLLADHDYSERRRVEDLLESLGVEVDGAANGLEVLGLVRVRPYDVVIMADAMPVMSGSRAACVLRVDSRFRQLPLLAVVDELSLGTEFLKQRLDSGFTRVLPRPLTRERLEAELHVLAGLPLSESEGPSAVHAEPSPEPAASPQAAASLSSGTRPAPADLSPSALPGRSAPNQSDPAASGSQLPPLEGVDLRRGLDRIMGNERLYLRILRDFEKLLDETVDEARRKEAEGDRPAVMAAIHKIKGTSGNVAATQLYKEVVETEQGLKENPDRPDRAEVLEGLFQLMETTRDRLSVWNAARTAGEASPSPAKQETSPEANAEALRKALDECLSLCRDYATAAQDVFAEVRQLLGDREAERVHLIENSLDAFDFDEAARELLSLTQGLHLTTLSSHEQ